MKHGCRWVGAAGWREGGKAGLGSTTHEENHLIRKTRGQVGNVLGRARRGQVHSHLMRDGCRWHPSFAHRCTLTLCMHQQLQGVMTDQLAGSGGWLAGEGWG